MSIIVWLILGLLSGFIADRIVNTSRVGLIPDLVVGIVGAVVSGLAFTHFFDRVGVTSPDLYSMCVAALGAVLLLLVFRLVVRGRTA